MKKTLVGTVGIVIVLLIGLHQSRLLAQNPPVECNVGCTASVCCTIWFGDGTCYNFSLSQPTCGHCCNPADKGLCDMPANSDTCVTDTGQYMIDVTGSTTGTNCGYCSNCVNPQVWCEGDACPTGPPTVEGIEWAYCSSGGSSGT